MLVLLKLSGGYCYYSHRRHYQYYHYQPPNSYQGRSSLLVGQTALVALLSTSGGEVGLCVWCDGVSEVEEQAVCLPPDLVASPSD